MRFEKQLIPGWLLLAVLALISCKNEPADTTQHSPLMQMAESNLATPVATKKPRELSIHGDVRQDPYYWLNDRENPEVIDYLTAENT